MATITATYLGDLRVESVHAASGTRLITDAPVDNNGKGEGFSPTDIAPRRWQRAMTIIGIYGKMHDVDVTGTSIEVTKTMSANPRRIGKLEVVFTMPDREYTDKQKTMIERARPYLPGSSEPAPRRRTGIHVPLEALALICRKITDLFRRKEKSLFSEKIVISKRIKNVFRQSMG